MRDRTFALEDAAGGPRAILKASNPCEDSEVLEMEAEAALHVTAVDPGLHIAVPWRAREPGGTEPARPALPATIGPAEQPPPASPTTLLRWTDRTSAALWSAHLCSATKAAISEPGS